MKSREQLEEEWRRAAITTYLVNLDNYMRPEEREHCLAQLRYYGFDSEAEARRYLRTPLRSKRTLNPS